MVQLTVYKLMRQLLCQLLVCYMLIGQQLVVAQTSQWESFYSFYNTSSAVVSGQTIIVAAENALFLYNTTQDTSETITTLEGLSGDNISALAAYDNYIFVGHQNGLIAQIDTTTKKVTYDSSIERNANILGNQKEINHIQIVENTAFLATGFGIVTLNPLTLEFGDTYYFGSSSNRIEVFQVYIHKDTLYAATAQGLYSILSNNSQILEFSSWNKTANGKWVSLWEQAGSLYGAIDEGAATSLYLIDTTTQQQARYSGSFRSLSQHEDGIVLTLSSSVYAIDKSFTTTSRVSTLEGVKANTFMFAHQLNDASWIGTSKNGLVRHNSSETVQFLSPQGPLRNSIFDIETLSNELWIAHGDYSFTYNPYPLEKYGISHYVERQWDNISNDDLFNVDSVVRVVAHPSEIGSLYACSYHGGIVQLKDNQPFELWNTSNSGLESLTDGPNYVSIRVRDALVDDQGNLWSLTSFIERGLKKRSPSGQWTSYDLTEAVLDYTSEAGYSNLELYNNKFMFMGGVHSGLIAVDISQSPPATKRIIGQDYGLPSDDIRAIRLDNDNRLWVGTREGIAILYAPNMFFDEEAKLNSVIVQDDGNLRELLSGQFITDIEVDGNNQKWISTVSSGVFLVSPDGTEILQHFTKENSPLPSSSVKTIGVDNTTGKVYFGTLSGMVSYQGDAYQPAPDLSSVSLFPNPVRPDFTGNLVVRGVQQNARIKITDIAGNLVYDMTSDGGSVSWDLRSFSGARVRSGVYLFFISSKDGTDSTVKKAMIIN